jgi:hypothetical protein
MKTKKNAVISLQITIYVSNFFLLSRTHNLLLISSCAMIQNFIRPYPFGEGPFHCVVQKQHKIIYPKLIYLHMFVNH